MEGQTLGTGPRAAREKLQNRFLKLLIAKGEGERGEGINEEIGSDANKHVK